MRTRLLFDSVYAALFVTLVGVPLATLAFIHENAVAPLLRRVPAWMEWGLAPVYALVFLAGMVLTAGVVRRLLPRLVPGRYAFPGHPQSVAWALAFALQRVLELPPWRAMLFGFATLRYFTIRALLGRTAFAINTAADVAILDASLHTIEEEALLGAGVVLSGHMAEKGTLLLGGVHIRRGAEIFTGTSIGPNVTVGVDSSIGPRSMIWSDVQIGDDVYVGARASLSSGVRIGDNVVLGNDVTLEANVEVGEGAVIRSGVRVPKGTKIPEGASYLPRASSLREDRMTTDGAKGK